MILSAIRFRRFGAEIFRCSDGGLHSYFGYSSLVSLSPLPNALTETVKSGTLNFVYCRSQNLTFTVNLVDEKTKESYTLRYLNQPTGPPFEYTVSKLIVGSNDLVNTTVVKSNVR